MNKLMIIPLLAFIMVACGGDKEKEIEKKPFCDCLESSIDNAMQGKESPEGCDWINNLSPEEQKKQVENVEENCPDLMGYLKMLEDNSK